MLFFRIPVDTDDVLTVLHGKGFEEGVTFEVLAGRVKELIREGW